MRATYGIRKGYDPLQFLLDLNLELAAREEHTEHVIGPGLLTLAGAFADEYDFYVTDAASVSADE